MKFKLTPLEKNGCCMMWPILHSPFWFPPLCRSISTIWQAAEAVFCGLLGILGYATSLVTILVAVLRPTLGDVVRPAGGGRNGSFWGRGSDWLCGAVWC